MYLYYSTILNSNYLNNILYLLFINKEASEYTSFYANVKLSDNGHNSQNMS